MTALRKPTPFSAEAVALSAMWSQVADAAKRMTVDDIEAVRCEDGTSVTLIVTSAANPHEPLVAGGTTPLPFRPDAWRKALTAIAAPLGAEVEVADAYDWEEQTGPWRRVR